jgi:glyoxylase-like metal-dependent hydrolase (beta-lactamase superfamily II)
VALGGGSKTGAWLLAAALLAGCGSSVFLHITRRTLATDLRAVLGGGGNSAVLLEGEEAFVVDVKFGDYARRLRSEVEGELARQVKRILVTHSHLDHTGGLSLYPDVGAVLAHPRTVARLRGEGAVNIPFVEVEREVRLVLRGEELQVLYLGVGHTDGDLVAFLPRKRWLIAGDLFNTGYEPEVDESLGGNLLALRHTLDALLELPFEEVLPGHGEPGKRADVEKTRDYLKTLEAEVRSGLGRTKNPDTLVEELSRTPSPLKPMLFLATRAKSIRSMIRAVEAPMAGR